MRTHRYGLTCILSLSLATAALVAACGGSDSDTEQSAGSGGGASAGSAGSGGDSGSAGSGGSSAGASGTAGSGGSSGSAGSGGSAGASGTAGSGDSGSAGSGDSGSAGSGDSGSAGSGDSGSAGSGDSGSAGSGDSGSAGSGGSGSAGSGGSGSAGASGTAGSGGDSGSAGSGGISGSSGAGGAQVTGFDVQPSKLQTINVPIGATTPTITFNAKYDGEPINAAWKVDQGNIGTVSIGQSSTAVFTPTGTTGGLVNVVAGHSGDVLERPVMVKLIGAQNGADPANPHQAPQIASNPATLNEGGGIGGVGGEGLGGAVSDPAIKAQLNTPTSDGTAQGLRFLYPYDKTVWPRGMLAPLLMWDHTAGDADAIKISLTTTSGSFSWSGTFGRPAILAQTGGKFVRHPIPQDVWKMATDSAGGTTLNGQPDQLIVSLTVAKGGASYGPISETWTVAPTRLTGIIYYNSYGTRLVENYSGAVGGNKKFGGAVLSIHVGDTAPQLTAGTNVNQTGCRVCHSVSARGSRLVVHKNDSVGTSAYDLTPAGSIEHDLTTTQTFPGLAPDGSYALLRNGQIRNLPNDATAQPVKGLSSVSTNFGPPSFSPDASRVVFNPMQSSTLASPTQKLVVMNFDPSTFTFSAPTVVADYTGQAAAVRPGWPAFFPDGKSVVFQEQTAAGSDGNADGALYTRRGAKGVIAWAQADGAGGVTRLDALNGIGKDGQSYLPKLATPYALACTADGESVGGLSAAHADDTNLNYEPTVNPVASGGYAWVVFTSRRLYGNEAVIPPYCSDPRGVDLVKNITTKKLWVAAVNLNAQPGEDASHPAFYLPAQELLAGNARGFWVLDPCRQDGDGCESGDQCCNGYCQPNGSGGALVCSNTPPESQCSNLQEKCSSNADCCDKTNECIGGFCAQSKP